MLGGPQPVYLSNLAACLLKLEMWDLASSAATRALVYDPKHIKALYRRALARKELGRAKAALAGTQPFSMVPGSLDCSVDMFSPRSGVVVNH